MVTNWRLDPFPLIQYEKNKCYDMNHCRRLTLLTVLLSLLVVLLFFISVYPLTASMQRSRGPCVGYLSFTATGVSSCLIVPCVCQSLTLWQEITHDMFRLWFLGEEDLLSDTQRYKLTDTGQGMQRVQQSPRTYKAMQVGTVGHERRVLRPYTVVRTHGYPSLVFPPVLLAFSVGPYLYVGDSPVDPPLPHDVRLAIACYGPYRRFCTMRNMP